MAGETELDTLLHTMSAKLVGGVYIFVTIDDHVVPTGLKPRMVFQEAEGTTLVLLKKEAEANNLAYEFPC